MAHVDIDPESIATLLDTAMVILESSKKGTKVEYKLPTKYGNIFTMVNVEKAESEFLCVYTTIMEKKGSPNKTSRWISKELIDPEDLFIVANAISNETRLELQK